VSYCVAFLLMSSEVKIRNCLMADVAVCYYLYSYGELDSAGSLL